MGNTVVGNSFFLEGIEGQSTGDIVIGTFTDNDNSPTYNNIVINWGDGSAPQSITPPTISNNLYTIIANHLYTNAGTYGITITILNTNNSSECIISSQIIIADAELTINSIPTITSNGIIDNLPLVQFNDANPNSSFSDFSALIDWNDGLPMSLGTITQPGGVGTPYIVSGTHTYVKSGNYIVQILISDKDGAKLTVVNVISVTVAKAQSLIIINGFPIFANKNVRNTFNIGTFIDYINNNSNYVVNIDWGDGKNSLRNDSVTKLSTSGEYLITSSHKYKHRGEYLAKLILDNGLGVKIPYNFIVTVR